MNFGSSYDRWLEQPYIDQARQDSLMEQYAEVHGLDEEEAAELDWDTVAEYYADAADDAAIERAEAERDDPCDDWDRW